MFSHDPKRGIRVTVTCGNPSEVEYGVRDASVLCAAPGCRVRDLNKTKINTLRPGQNGRQ